MSQGDLVAHRGYPYRYPENSLAGVQAALAVGARYVEVDVQLSRDGIPLLFHDRDLRRLCHQPGAVHDYAWRQLQKFILYGEADQPLQLARAPLAVLSDLVAVIKTAPAARFFIELKRVAVAQFGATAVVDAVLPILQPVAGQCCVISYNLPALQQVRQRCELPIGVVIDEWAGRADPAIVELQPEFLFCNLSSLPADEPVQLPGARLAVFETVDPGQARRLMAQGVDLVETFAIGEMRRQLEPAGV
ncbi:glycerophosphodiester phosphodiesterase family protein [Thiohalophilus sp.]|uniref:glycerophosphodiester phosphodiesterase family protein n=1 Tax=Thiohalophilus sp. TaxID=3028392 RepID=UPI002ACE351B|nr:glycerophosphodiester phosphodiesterase family protein [Thiohalophilus sp.]MDZ7662153.1 glycerophosphodiester phosphodiesterase family protein [Thiohalophilus sp.]